MSSMISRDLSNGIRAGSDSYPHVTVEMMLAMLADLNSNREKSQKSTISMEQKCVETDQKMFDATSFQNQKWKVQTHHWKESFDELKETSHKTQSRIDKLVGFDRLEIKMAQIVKNKPAEKGINENDTSLTSATPTLMVKKKVARTEEGNGKDDGSSGDCVNEINGDGLQMQSTVMKSGLESEDVFGSLFITTFGGVRIVFDEMLIKDMISWNSLLSYENVELDDYDDDFNSDNDEKSKVEDDEVDIKVNTYCDKEWWVLKAGNKVREKDSVEMQMKDYRDQQWVSRYNDCYNNCLFENSHRVELNETILKKREHNGVEVELLGQTEMLYMSYEWGISGTDVEVIHLGKKFSSKLKRKLKDTKGFVTDEFVRMLKQFLENIAKEAINNMVKVREEWDSEGRNSRLQDIESEIIDLKDKIELLEMTVAKGKKDLEESELRLGIAEEELAKIEIEAGTLKNELESVKEEKNQTLKNEQDAISSVERLLEEKDKILTELESPKEEEEKSKKAMESLASALHEVSSEKRELKEKFLSQSDHYNETEIEDLKLVLETTSKKYETMLGKARHEIVDLGNVVEQTKKQFEGSMVDWEMREAGLVNHVKEFDEEVSSMGKEMNRLGSLVERTKGEADAAWEKESEMRYRLKDVEDEVIYLQETLRETQAETLKLKGKMLDKESEFQSVVHENDELRVKQDDSLKKIKELSLLVSKVKKYPNTHLEDKVSSNRDGIDKVEVSSASMVRERIRRDGHDNESG